MLILLMNRNVPLSESDIKDIKQIKRVKFGKEFNQSLDNLPDGVIEIEFVRDSIFNQKLDNLPQSLKILILNNSFNQPLDFLPNNLEKLYICYNYSNSLLNLPTGLKSIGFTNKSFNTHYSKSIIEYINLVKDKVDFYDSY